MAKSTILVAGCAGFIGSNLTDKLLDLGRKVIGIGNFNNYYDQKLKREAKIKNGKEAGAEFAKFWILKKIKSAAKIHHMQ